MFFLVGAVCANAETLEAVQPVRSLASDLWLHTGEYDLPTGYKEPDYWKRHKVLKACAWTSVSAGAVLIYGGLVWGLASGYVDDIKEGKGWAIMMGTGAGLAAASIPLFVYSRKNRKKALRLSTGVGSVQKPLPCGSISLLPAIGISLHF